MFEGVGLLNSSAPSALATCTFAKLTTPKGKKVILLR